MVEKKTPLVYCFCQKSACSCIWNSKLELKIEFWNSIWFYSFSVYYCCCELLFFFCRLNQNNVQWKYYKYSRTRVAVQWLAFVGQRKKNFISFLFIFILFCFCFILMQQQNYWEMFLECCRRERESAIKYSGCLQTHTLTHTIKYMHYMHGIHYGPYGKVQVQVQVCHSGWERERQYVCVYM